MSAVAYDWTSFDEETPPAPPLRGGGSGREEEFRAALDDYMARYRRAQATRAADAGRGPRRSRLAGLARWLAAGREPNPE